MPLLVTKQANTIGLMLFYAACLLSTWIFTPAHADDDEQVNFVVETTIVSHGQEANEPDKSGKPILEFKNELEWLEQIDKELKSPGARVSTRLVLQIQQGTPRSVTSGEVVQLPMHGPRNILSFREVILGTRLYLKMDDSFNLEIKVHSAQLRDAHSILPSVATSNRSVGWRTDSSPFSFRVPLYGSDGKEFNATVFVYCRPAEVYDKPCHIRKKNQPENAWVVVTQSLTKTQKAHVRQVLAEQEFKQYRFEQMRLYLARHDVEKYIPIAHQALASLAKRNPNY